MSMCERRDDLRIEAAADCDQVARIAAPRHVNVMHGPTYQPEPWSPARTGAAAYAHIPSLMGNRRVPFRSGK